MRFSNLSLVLAVFVSSTQIRAESLQAALEQFDSGEGFVGINVDRRVSDFEVLAALDKDTRLGLLAVIGSDSPGDPLNYEVLLRLRDEISDEFGRVEISDVDAPKEDDFSRRNLRVFVRVSNESELVRLDGEQEFRLDERVDVNCDGVGDEGACRGSRSATARAGESEAMSAMNYYITVDWMILRKLPTDKVTGNDDMWRPHKIFSDWISFSDADRECSAAEVVSRLVPVIYASDVLIRPEDVVVNSDPHSLGC